MPELPEVETTVAGLRPVLEGKRLTLVEPRRADLRRPIPTDLRQRMTGARVTQLARRAKYGLIETDRGDVMIFHLGMSGRWRIDPAELEKHDHLVLETEEDRRLVLNDPRRFGSLDLIRLEDMGQYGPFAAMGPEPLGDDFTGSYLKAVTRDRKAPIKQLLLDQRNVAGLGNIYVCEALHMAGILPSRMGGGISKRRYDKLVVAIKQVLASAIAAGGSSLRDFVQPDGELGYFAKEWLVYGREGEDCACGGAVLRKVDSGRSTFYCRKCQS
ncbi:bifunctional DNA-formamidopyrimidine glycosylase/DNA-(apurinic or apyrimidinic site) lyase [Sphingorhabdus sp. EL138]|uniref:bifunctional DNA-formamidopyrimidine glycosylase/DNA-(apurinic or apyrimidinic site) lyase n=1 Tax=Sphingorhabdus sp. EL138 TaxID=2073156 RepID=UPI000D68E2C4|nr:bifunctional DNA-formamidopyrimidine glycosylase/DNA-(apurinic or apyrimidinic site) lyase [Sphingorhabdus sp. EL138]